MRKCGVDQLTACSHYPLTNQRRGGLQQAVLLTNQMTGMAFPSVRACGVTGRVGGACAGGGWGDDGVDGGRKRKEGRISRKGQTSATGLWSGLVKSLGMTFALLTLLSCQPLVSANALPQPVESLTCSSHNLVVYTCTWVAMDTGEPLNHTFEYHEVHGSVGYQSCPEYTAVNECTVTTTTGSTQDVRVTSTNQFGSVTTNIRFNPSMEAVPLPPANLRLSAISSSVLQADWDLPLGWDSLYSGMLKYRYRYASHYDPHTWTQLSTDDRQGLLQLLQAYTMYKVQVSSSYVMNGVWSDWSHSAEERTLEAAPKGKVQDLTTTTLNDSLAYERDISICWQPLLEQERQGIILGYLVTVTPHEDCLDQEQVNGTVYNDTSTMVLGLEKFCSYRVDVNAFNSQGTGEPATTDVRDMTATPNAPTGVTAETLSHQSVRVSWGEPTPIQGHVVNYTVSWMKALGQEPGWSEDVPATTLSLVVDGLEGYVLYSFRVSVRNKLGESGFSSEARTRTEEWLPESAPTNVTVQPVVTDPTHLYVDWVDVPEEAAHGVIQEHSVYFCLKTDLALISEPAASLNASGCIGAEGKQSFPGNMQRPVRLTGVEPFSEYMVWVSASTSAGEGPRSDHPSVGHTSQGAPSPPVHPRAMNATATSVALSWSPPLDKNGIIDRYMILVKNNASFEQHEYNAGAAESYVVEGLDGYVNYSFQIVACTVHCGLPSDLVFEQTHIGVPQQPQDLSIAAGGRNQIKLEWAPPLHPNGPISSYLVSYRLFPTGIPTTVPPTAITPSADRLKRVASLTTTQANFVDDWQSAAVEGTELLLPLDCELISDDSAEFVFRVAAVNVVEGEELVGAVAEHMRGVAGDSEECSLAGKTLTPLLWLILPAGAVLLFALLTSLHYIQSKLGKSWPDPVYTDIVKNRKSPSTVPRVRESEKEEFNSIRAVYPDEPDEVIVAEEYVRQPFHCMPQTVSDALDITRPLDMKHGLGVTTGCMRTVSVDSGVPPSPQDQLDFPSSEDVFDPEGENSSWVTDTYSFDSPKVLVNSAGCRGSQSRRLRSVSMSSSEEHRSLPAIDENRLLTSEAAELAAKKLVVGSAGLESHLPTGQKSDAPPVETSDTVLAPSGYVGNDMTYIKLGLLGNERVQETSFTSVASTSGTTSGYVPSSMAYSVLAAPQPTFSMASNGYVREEDLSYSKLGMIHHPETLCASGPSSSPSSSPKSASSDDFPYVSTDSVTYTKLASAEDHSESKDVGEVQDALPVPSSSKTPAICIPQSSQLVDYVRGADLSDPGDEQSSPPLSPVSTSPLTPACLVYPTAATMGCPAVSSEQTSGETASNTGQDGLTIVGLKEEEEERAVVGMRSRNESSSSSGYTSDSGGLLATSERYVTTSSKPKKHVCDYANLAFSTSESDTDSDLDVKSDLSDGFDGKAVIVKDRKSAKSIKSGNHTASFVEYVDSSENGVNFINDFQKPEPAGDKVYATHCEGQSSCEGKMGNVDLQSVEELQPSRTGVCRSAVEGLESQPPKPHMLSIGSAVYQVPRKERTGEESSTQEGDDGYVSFAGDSGTDSGYVMRVIDPIPRDNGHYLTMSPIDNVCTTEEFV